ncbi:V-type ATP synthase subunit C [candidate division NPL-UPA2 bacterium]|nr:V-type ATP synthase subunit C [candidate division NPL-UPA2 bacterium]
MAEDRRYAYAVGRIRALETRLLRRERFDQMVGAEDAEETLRALADTDYGPLLSEIKSPDEFEIALNKELTKVLSLISHLSFDPELTDLFRLRYDFHNLKVLLKQKYLARSPVDSKLCLIDAGVIEGEKLRKIMEGEDYSELPDELRTAVDKSEKGFEETGDPQMIDIILDKEMYSLFHERSSGNPFLKEYFQISADLTNIRIFLRVRALRKERDFFEEVFLEGGKLELSFFLRLYGEPIDNFASALSPTAYGQLVSQGIKYWKENGSWSKLERLSDNHILNFLGRAKHIVFGLEPLIGYLLARENEIKMLRMIMVGKLNKLEGELIRSNLRDTYV